MSPLLVLAVFGAGIASFLAPCVLPLVPVWIAMAGADADDAPSGALVRSTLVFVAGFTTVFALLGVAAGGLAHLLQSPTTTRVGGVVVVLFAVAMLLDRTVLPTIRRRAQPDLTRRPGVFRAFTLGVVFGASWTPCVGPLLGSVLVLASTGGRADGVILLTAYAIGIGLPFVLTALTVTSSAPLRRRLAAHARGVRIASGVLLIVVGVAVASGRYASLLSPVAEVRGA